ncbi:CidB/LrgB family autolysis modulator [Vibrio olivae]|uniref:CidB/LrgB family autolysis modulator n=1 Tax=Vibrio olivae TaxID=1243002 RepID=A0ABV5HJ99_9VIBR
MWLLITLIVFFATREFSKRINNPLFNPLLLSIAILIPLLMVLDIPFETYYADNQSISFLLQPAVVALAYPLYEQLPQIRTNWRIIMLACTVGSVLSMVTAGGIALLMHADIELIAALLGKSVTTPIAMEVASHLGGEPAIAAMLVLIVGLLGAIIAYPIYTLLNISHPVARGLTMGTISHALGTATCAEKNPQDAAFSSLALVVCGVITSILAPSFFAAIIWLAGT